MDSDTNTFWGSGQTYVFIFQVWQQCLVLTRRQGKKKKKLLSCEFSDVDSSAEQPQTKDKMMNYQTL